MGLEFAVLDPLADGWLGHTRKLCNVCLIDEAKTDAGNRDVDLSLDVMDELMAWRAERQPAHPDEYVFPTASGRPRDKENISRRVLGPTVRRANELRAERKLPPLPKVTAHALRRTYISLMRPALRCPMS